MVALVLSLALNAYLVGFTRRPQTFVVWDVPTTIKPKSYLFSTMFDTFTMSIRLEANSTLYVYVFTPSQFVQFYESGGAVKNSVVWYFGETIEFTFNLSRGCAGYVWVVYNPSDHPVSVKPYVTATYSPSSQPTGVCANAQ